jgi:predicted Fe-Mo cluster-binding NifX family protein
MNSPAIVRRAGTRFSVVHYNKSKNLKGKAMKVAVSAVDNNLDAQVDPRFGRAGYFLIIETDSLVYESIENPNVNALGGAGIQSAQLVIDKGITSVLTGKCGPKAFEVFQKAGISIYEDIEGSVREAVKTFQSDKLSPSQIAGGKPHMSVK